MSFEFSSSNASWKYPCTASHFVKYLAVTGIACNISLVGKWVDWPLNQFVKLCAESHPNVVFLWDPDCWAAPLCYSWFFHQHSGNSSMSSSLRPAFVFLHICNCALSRVAVWVSDLVFLRVVASVLQDSVPFWISRSVCGRPFFCSSLRPVHAVS